MVEYGEHKKSSHERSSGPSFGDITGQNQLKQALLAVGTNDALDGLLIQGEKGTAKSTAVRALGELLGNQRVVAGCPYGCSPDDPNLQCADCRERADLPVESRPVPLVTLPLGATRERVVGTLSVADALAGEYEFDPGLLARAHRGVLYVDEVNLLDDHLVDVLLDAAAGGHNRVERDGVSVTHPAEFTLVGTMNPEEGDLRPQLRDRFALQTTVTACEDIEDRVEIIDRALGENVKSEPEESPARRFRRARELLSDVVLPEEFKTEIADLCREAGIDGHRGDIATVRTARTLAALDGRGKVIEADVCRASEFALAHRLTSRPFEDSPDIDDLLDDHFEDSESPDESETEDDEPDSDAERSETEPDADGQSETGEQPEDAGEGDDGGTSPAEQSGEEGEDSGKERPGQQPQTADDTDAGGEQQSGEQGEPDSGDNNDDGEQASPLVPGQSRASIGEATTPEVDPPDALAQGGAGGGGSTRTAPTTDGTGSRVRTTTADASDDIDAAASVRAAATRGADGVQSRDLRQSVRVGETATLVLFVVDASASMQPAMRAAKGTVLELLRDAYQHRDEVGFVAFAGESAEVLLPPTDSVSLAARHLKELPTGDRTPLPDGLRTAATVLDRADPTTSLVVVVTDGKGNVADGSPVTETRQAARALADRETRVLVVDADDGSRGGLVEPILEETDGQRLPLSALSADRVDAAVDPS